MGEPARSLESRVCGLRARARAAADRVHARRRARASGLHRAVRARSGRQRDHGLDATLRRDAGRGARRDALDSPTAAGKALASAVAKRAAPPTLGMVFPFSSHNFDLRYWLAAFGVHPDRDVRLVAIPPPLMVESLRAGHVDGFCVGEPWNSIAVADGLGRIVATQVAAHAARRRESARRARAGGTGGGAAREAPASARGCSRVGRRSRESR